MTGDKDDETTRLAIAKEDACPWLGKILGTYIELLASTATRGILLAWSLMHTGHCHINTKDTGSIACTLAYHGFVRDNPASYRARARAKIGWLR